MTHGERVRREILRMGLQLWRVDSALVTTRRVAKELGMTHSNVIYHFKSSAGLRDSIAFHAVKEGDDKVISKLITAGHTAVSHLSEADKLAYLKQGLRI